MADAGVHRWIKTPCGRAKYAELAQRPIPEGGDQHKPEQPQARQGPGPLPNPDHSGDHSGSSTP